MKVFGRFRLDTANQCLWRHRDTGDEERILLTPKAFAVLAHLVKHAGRLVTHNELLETVWPDTIVEPQAVKKHILDVRTALGDRPKNSLFIETVTRRGYWFIAPVSEHIAPSPVASGRSTPDTLVGRGGALEELHEGWRRVLTGDRQIVFIGVRQQNLARWLQEARRLPLMGSRDVMKKAFALEEKARVLAEGAKLHDEQLHVYLEREGIKLADFERWRIALEEEGRSPSATTGRIRQLERELARKEKALAEAAALLVLKKTIAKSAPDYGRRRRRLEPELILKAIGKAAVGRRAIESGLQNRRTMSLFAKRP